MQDAEYADHLIHNQSSSEQVWKLCGAWRGWRWREQEAARNTLNRQGNHRYEDEQHNEGAW